MKYTEQDFAKAIEALLEILGYDGEKEIFDKLLEDHPVIDEVYQFGINGPVGLGLGSIRRSRSRRR